MVLKNLHGNDGETDIENRLMDMERGGEGEMHGKSNTETYITICKIDSQQEFSLWLRKLKQVFWTNLKGWDGEGQGREFQMRSGAFRVVWPEMGGSFKRVGIWLIHVKV